MSAFGYFALGCIVGGSIAVIALGLVIGGHDDRY